MLLRPSANMALSKVSTWQCEGFCVVIHGEDTDTIRYHKKYKKCLSERTTRKTTAKTTNHTTGLRRNTTIFESVKNLIRLFLTVPLFSRKCVQFLRNGEEGK